jgi:uncharacterized membrane protein YidH (DUF202 family)
MEKPGLQYERTLLSWWRTLLSMIVIVAAIGRIGLLSSNSILVITAALLLSSSILLSLFTTIDLWRNIKGIPSLVYGPFIIQKRCLSGVLVFAALFYAVTICLR